MSDTYISAALRRRIWSRAGGRCEYCLLAEGDAFFPHEPDHVISVKRGGGTTVENLALACFDCNRYKGTDIASLDPFTDELVALFNPRTDRWGHHFSVVQGQIRGLTPIGRATARLLQLNLGARVEVRRLLMRTNRCP